MKPEQPETLRKPPTTMKELRDELAEAFVMVKIDRRYVPQAKELANIAGKILDTAKIELVRAGLVGEEPNEEFMKFVGKSSGKSLRPERRRSVLS